MTKPQSRFDQPGDEPLDPAVERVRQKLQKIQIVSLSVMLLGFAAVMAAISYKVWFEPSETSSSAAVPADPAGTVETSVQLPVDARIVETSIAGDRILVRLALPSGPALWVLDVNTGQVISRINLTNG